MTSRIGNHIYAKGATEAVKLYKEAFELVEKGEPWLDNEGLIIHQDLMQKDGNLFLGVTEYNHLPNDAFINKFSTDVCPPMLFYVFYTNEADLQRTFTVLSNNATLCRELEAEGKDIICEILDKFGVFWHLRFVAHENRSLWNVMNLFNSR